MSSQLSPTHLAKLNPTLQAYAISKVSNVLHARELNKRLKDKGVTACSLHPGVVRTNVTRNSRIMKTYFCCCQCTTIDEVGNAQR